MNNKNIKVVDEHNIDRNASVMFAFDLEGSEYVSYSIERDEENSNIFVSKIIRNLDNSFNMLDIDDAAEKSKLSEIVKTLISNSVSNENDKLVGDSVTLNDGKLVKFINVIFNKEQRLNVQKTYITTVKKEVVRVSEKYYAIEVVVEQPAVTEIFPTVTPVVEPATEVFPEPVLPVVPEPTPAVVDIPVNTVPSQPEVQVSAPVVEPILPEAAPTVVEPITVSTPVVEVPKVETPVVSATPVVEVPVNTVLSQPEVQVSAPVVEPILPEAAPAVVETPVSSIPLPVVEPVEAVKVPEPTVAAVPTPEVVAPTPVSASVANNEVNPALIFNAAKETNLNAALGEVANSTSIPVENIEQVREFGVDEPVAVSAPNVQPAPAQPAPVIDNSNVVVGGGNTNKGGFANSKFFMVVAIAFFLASCVFLGYEVFNYFQLTK